MRSFAIEEPGSPVLALYATLGGAHTKGRQLLFAKLVICRSLFVYIANFFKGNSQSLPYFFLLDYNNTAESLKLERKILMDFVPCNNIFVKILLHLG